MLSLVHRPNQKPETLKLLRIAYHLSAWMSSTFVELDRFQLVQPSLDSQSLFVEDLDLVSLYFDEPFPGQLVQRAIEDI